MVERRVLSAFQAKWPGARQPAQLPATDLFWWPAKRCLTFRLIKPLEAAAPSRTRQDCTCLKAAGRKGSALPAISFLLLVGEGDPVVRLKSGRSFGFDNLCLSAKVSVHSLSFGLPPRLVDPLHPRPNRTASPGCAVLFCILVCSLCVR
jgi:hypothetical protein